MTSTFPQAALPLKSLVEALAVESVAQYKENFGEEPENTALEVFGEQFMENTSEAGYSEARPEGRLASRALANIVRVSRGDMKAIKSALGYDRNEYYDFALAEVVLSSLDTWSEVKPALYLIAKAKGVQARGPFYPNKRELRLNADSNWSFYNTITSSRSPEVQAASLKLASIFKVNQADLKTISDDLLKAGHKPEEINGILAKVILETVRTAPRFQPVLSEKK